MTLTILHLCCNELLDMTKMTKYFNHDLWDCGKPTNLFKKHVVADLTSQTSTITQFQLTTVGKIISKK